MRGFRPALLTGVMGMVLLSHGPALADVMLEHLRRMTVLPGGEMVLQARRLLRFKRVLPASLRLPPAAGRIVYCRIEVRSPSGRLLYRDQRDSTRKKDSWKTLLRLPAKVTRPCAGCTLKLEIWLRERPPIPGCFFLSLNQENLPTRRLALEVRAPGKALISHRLVGLPERAPQKALLSNRQAGFTRWVRANPVTALDAAGGPQPRAVYSWAFTGLAPADRPRSIRVSVGCRLAEVAAWYRRRFEDNQQHAGPAVRDFFQAAGVPLTLLPDHGQTTLLCRRRIRGVLRAVEGAMGASHDWALAPRPLAETLKKKRGDCKERAALAIWAFRRMGLSAQAVLLTPVELDSLRAPAGAREFVHAAVEVNCGGNRLVLDPGRSGWTYSAPAPGGGGLLSGVSLTPTPEIRRLVPNLGFASMALSRKTVTRASLEPLSLKRGMEK